MSIKKKSTKKPAVTKTAKIKEPENLVRLNLGSGIVVKKGFINIDLYEPDDLKYKRGQCKNAIWQKGAEYIKADITLGIPLADDSVDVVEMFEVLEHLPFRKVIPVLKEIRRVMKPGAKLLMHMPNFDGLMKDWLEVMTTQFNADVYIYVMETIYGNQLAPGEFHQTAFNPQFLNWCLTQAGFEKGTLSVVPKHKPIPSMGSEKIAKGTVSRNELLMAEVIK